MSVKLYKNKTMARKQAEFAPGVLISTGMLFLAKQGIWSMGPAPVSSMSNYENIRFKFIRSANDGSDRTTQPAPEPHPEPPDPKPMPKR